MTILVSQNGSIQILGNQNDSNQIQNHVRGHQVNQISLKSNNQIAFQINQNCIKILTRISGKHQQITKEFQIDNVHKIECGSNFTSILDTNGNVIIIDDKFNQQSINNSFNNNIFTDISCGQQSIQMISQEKIFDLIKSSKDEYKLQILNKNLNVKPIQLACGDYHTSILTSHNDVIMTGNNLQGQCDMPQLGGLKVVQVACGDQHTAILLENGTLRLFGRNKLGECDEHAFAGYKVTRVECGTSHTVALCQGGKLIATGNNECGQIQIPSIWKNNYS